jgi:hypothetical protein
MVHKSGKLEDIRGKLMLEITKDKEFINKYFQKLPVTAQQYITTPTLDYKALKPIIPFEIKGAKKLEKRRYGVIGIHEKKIYLGYVKPINADKAEVRLIEVFP